MKKKNFFDFVTNSIIKRGVSTTGTGGGRGRAEPGG